MGLIDSFYWRNQGLNTLKPVLLKRIKKEKEREAQRGGEFLKLKTIVGNKMSNFQGKDLRRKEMTSLTGDIKDIQRA